MKATGPDGPRRRQQDGRRLRRVQDHPPLDRRRHALRQRDDPDRDEAQRLSRASRARQARPPASSPSTPTTPTARSRTSPAAPSIESNDQEIAAVDETGLVARCADRPGGDHGPLSRARSPSSAPPCRSGMPIPLHVRAEQRRRQARRRRSGRNSASSRRNCAPTSSSSAASTSTSRGTLPTPKQVAAFVADKTRDKRDETGRRARRTPEYSYYFANKWADVLRVKRGTSNNNDGRAYRHVRVPRLDSRGDRRRQALRRVRPRDPRRRRRRDKNPPTVWYKDIRTPSSSSTTPRQVFLGMRMACANCHHHPYEKWSQDDYWGLAAF